MLILPDVYMVGSGAYGIEMSHTKDCNVYIVDGKDGLTLIDAGVGIEPERIVKNIELCGLLTNNISKIILTHGHADHAGGAKYFKDITNAEVMAFGIESKMISEADEKGLGLDIARNAGFYPFDYKFNPCEIDKVLEDGDLIKIGCYELMVIHTPGHSKGSICLYGNINNKNVLFAGDTVAFGGLISLQNIPGVDIHDYSWGVNRLSDLNVDSFLPGHMLFTIERGQRHIDLAVDSFNKLGIPKSLI